MENKCLCRYCFVHKRNRVASPRKLMNPITSVTVVRTTEPASAGSIPVFFISSGMATPESAAANRVIIIAAASTPATTTGKPWIKPGSRAA